MCFNGHRIFYLINFINLKCMHRNIRVSVIMAGMLNYHRASFNFGANFKLRNMHVQRLPKNTKTISKF